MSFKYAYILPILCPVWFVLTFMITYAVSVFKQDIYPLFAYVSDTGTWSPESCIFGLMLNIGAVIQAVIGYIRYLQVKYICDKESFKSPFKRLNSIAFIIGLIAVVGVSVLGNFQETNAFYVHLFGAGAAFGLGSLYLWLQTYISFRIYPMLGSKKLNVMRVACAIVCTIALFVTSVFGLTSFLEFVGDDFTKWSEDDGGYVFHCLSVVAEWILILTTLLFLGLFAHEFKKISITEPLVDEAPSKK